MNMAMLTTGLDILRLLAEAETPLTATAIAERVGLHVSNVSRTLRVLSAHGYVCKPSYHSFAVDLGVLSLAGAAANRLPLVARTRSLVLTLAQKSGLQATLAALHQEQVLYVHRAQPAVEAGGGQGVISAVAGGFPLHCSVVGLRLLLDLPAARAHELLAAAGRRHGWEQPTPTTPTDPLSCLRAARQRLQGGVLRTDHWDTAGEIALAIAVHVPDQPPLALGLNGPIAEISADPIPLLTLSAQDLSAAFHLSPAPSIS